MDTTSDITAHRRPAGLAVNRCSACLQVARGAVWTGADLGLMCQTCFDRWDDASFADDATIDSCAFRLALGPGFAPRAIILKPGRRQPTPLGPRSASVDRIRFLMAQGLNDSQIARVLKVARSTVQRKAYYLRRSAA